jgi:hypothetical protein
MNLTPKNWKKSEVEEQKERVVVGTKLIYSDMCNFRRFEVTEVEGTLLTLVDDEGQIDYADMDSLQIGWSFSQN